MARGDDIQARLQKHGVALGQLCKKLPLNPEATHIRKQLFRSATSAAPNYAEARSAESRLDFVHKQGTRGVALMAGLTPRFGEHPPFRARSPDEGE